MNAKHVTVEDYNSEWKNEFERISDIELYPVDAKRLIAEGFQGVKHFVYKE